MRKKTLLWLDDQRNPFIQKDFVEEAIGIEVAEVEIFWARNYKELKEFIHSNPFPDYISFDHDLANEHYTPEYFWKDYEASKRFQEWKYPTYKEKTGLDCAKMIKEYRSILAKTKTLAPLGCFVHSANPVGADWIKKALKSR